MSRAITRRESLRRMTILAAGWGMPFSFTAASDLSAAPWVHVELKPVTAAGYGTDPDLLHPAPAPWPTTLTLAQQQLVARLADILIPADGLSPSASDAGVVEVLDEWVSAPYPDQQAHRLEILSGLTWCNAQARHLFARPFTNLTPAEQIRIIDAIAYPEADLTQDNPAPVQFFDLFRTLVAGIYYTSPAGVRELGYQGNLPISGDYPGPSQDALHHLDRLKKELGLS
ncbi:MAG: gluconate 2-dehydrogenase subunit 3 family protein [bacterium]